MRLGLSSAAAPDASLDGLLEACARRGLAALELRVGDGHGIGTDGARVDAAVARRRAGAAGVAITGLRAPAPAGAVEAARVAGTAAALGATLIVEPGPGGVDPVARWIRDAVRAAAGDGERPCVVLRGDVRSESVDGVLSAGLDVAWDAEVTGGSLGAIGARLLRGAGERLRHIRVLGGGPEVASHEGRGVGELMGRLALAAYDGTMVVAPSSPRYRVAWEAWLGRRGGWGCGGRTADPSLVRLDVAIAEGGGT